MQISRKIHAQFYAECYTESKRNPSRIEAEACLHSATIPIGFRYDFATIAQRFRYDSAWILLESLGEICMKSSCNLLAVWNRAWIKHGYIPL